MIDKFVDSIDRSVADLQDGASIMISGFGDAGAPAELIEGVIRQGATDLTIISNNAGAGEIGIAALVKTGRVRKVICSFPRQPTSHHFDARYRAGDIELELVPQGNLAARIEAAGAGLGAIYTPTGYGTLLAAGKETREIDGRRYVLEYPIRADVALIKARASDRWGNLVYRKVARNFGPIMVMAAKTTIVQVAEIVPLGSLDPRRSSRPASSSIGSCSRRPSRRRRRERELVMVWLDRSAMAARVARDIPEGAYVNLGIGLPTLVGNFLPRDKEIVLQSENGLLGMGPAPAEDDVDWELINAGKQPVTLLAGGAFFHHGDSFAMMRGGHIDICVLGAFQVAVNGDLANWHTGAPDAIPAVGGDRLEVLAVIRLDQTLGRAGNVNHGRTSFGALRRPSARKLRPGNGNDREAPFEHPHHPRRRFVPGFLLPSTATSADAYRQTLIRRFIGNERSSPAGVSPRPRRREMSVGRPGEGC